MYFSFLHFCGQQIEIMIILLGSWFTYGFENWILFIKRDIAQGNVFKFMLKMSNFLQLVYVKKYTTKFWYFFCTRIKRSIMIAFN